jgi:hypothetical protein
MNDGDPNDLLKVRWVNIDKNYRQFNGMKSTLRFIIDKERILTFTPIKEPKLVGYDINNNSLEEEAIYKLSREEIRELAFAKSVDVELQGKYKLVIGKFNKWHTFRAFKNFINNT